MLSQTPFYMGFCFSKGALCPGAWRCGGLAPTVTGTSCLVRHSLPIGLACAPHCAAHHVIGAVMCMHVHMHVHAHAYMYMSRSGVNSFKNIKVHFCRSFTRKCYAYSHGRGHAAPAGAGATSQPFAPRLTILKVTCQMGL